MSTAIANKLKIVMESCRANARSLERLEKHLSAQWARPPVAIWHAGFMPAGASIPESRAQHFAEADVLLLLLNADFVATWNDDLSAAFEKMGDARRRVIPVLLEPCTWEHLPISQVPAVPGDNTPVVNGRLDEGRFHQAAKEIRALVDGILATPPMSRSATDPREEPPQARQGGEIASPDPSFLDLLAWSGRPKVVADEQATMRSPDNNSGIEGSVSYPIAIARLQRALGMPVTVHDPAHIVSTLNEAARRAEEAPRDAAAHGSPPRDGSTSPNTRSSWVARPLVTLIFGVLFGILLSAATMSAR